MMRDLIICTHNQVKDEVAEACNVHGKDKKCIQNFGLAFLQHIFILSVLKHSCGNTPSVPRYFSTGSLFYLTHIIGHSVTIHICHESESTCSSSLYCS